MLSAERTGALDSYLRAVKYQGLGELMGFAAWLLYDLKLSPETPVNLKLLREHLGRGSALVYFNHICLDDGPLILTFLLKEFGRFIKIIGGPESKKHYDFREGEAHGLLMRLASTLGVTLIPLVQHYDEENYSPQEVLESRLNFIRSARNILAVSGGVLMIAPEGTRSPNGVLHQGRKGIGFLAKLSAKSPVPVCFVPIGLIPQGSLSMELNWRLAQVRAYNFEINMGQPFRLTDFDKRSTEGITEILMKQLAELLPERMKGVYALQVKSSTVF